MIAKLISFIFLVIGILAIGYSVYYFNNTREFIATASEAEGVVIDVIKKYESDRDRDRDDGFSAINYTYVPLVEFIDGSGSLNTFTSKFGSKSPAFSIGELVTIIYDDANPQNARIKAFVSLWLLPIIGTVFGVIFTLFGGFLVLSPFFRKRRIKGL